MFWKRNCCRLTAKTSWLFRWNAARVEFGTRRKRESPHGLEHESVRRTNEPTARQKNPRIEKSTTIEKLVALNPRRESYLKAKKKTGGASTARGRYYLRCRTGITRGEIRACRLQPSSFLTTFVLMRMRTDNTVLDVQSSRARKYK